MGAPFVPAEPLWSENRVLHKENFLRVVVSSFRGCMEVAFPAEQGVVIALRKSHHQGPFTLATVTFDQRCHKGLPLRVPMALPEDRFGGRFTVCLECIVCQGFRLRAALRATLRADLRADIKGGLKGGQ